MPSDESKGSQLDAIGSLAQRQLDNTFWIEAFTTDLARLLPGKFPGGRYAATGQKE